MLLDAARNRADARRCGAMRMLLFAQTLFEIPFPVLSFLVLFPEFGPELFPEFFPNTSNIIKIIYIYIYIYIILIIFEVFGKNSGKSSGPNSGKSTRKESTGKGISKRVCANKSMRIAPHLRASARFLAASSNMFVFANLFDFGRHVRAQARFFLYMYICIYVYMYICVCTYMYYILFMDI